MSNGQGVTTFQRKGYGFPLPWEIHFASDGPTIEAHLTDERLRALWNLTRYRNVMRYWPRRDEWFDWSEEED